MNLNDTITWGDVEKGHPQMCSIVLPFLAAHRRRASDSHLCLSGTGSGGTHLSSLFRNFVAKYFGDWKPTIYTFWARLCEDFCCVLEELTEPDSFGADPAWNLARLLGALARRARRCM